MGGVFVARFLMWITYFAIFALWGMTPYIQEVVHHQWFYLSAQEIML
jgi:hypothetical protein